MMEDLKDHIEKSFRRLSSEDYSAEHIWKGIDYDWSAFERGRGGRAVFVGAQLDVARVDRIL